MKALTPQKAGTILKDGIVRGNALTQKQKRFLGWVKSGGNPNQGRKQHGG